MVQERKVQVHLLKGSADVQSQPEPTGVATGPQQSPQPITMRLESGQQLSIEVNQLIMSRRTVQGDEHWPDGVEAFNDVPLSDLIAAANRYASRPITIRDRQIGALRISGTFHLTDTAALAHKVADLLHLSVVEDGQSYRLLRP
jgi:transmembrane sensor